MHLLFDFDGTLINSFDCVMQKAILLAEEHKFKKISTQDIEKLRDLSSTEIIRFFQIPTYKIPMLISQMRKHLHQEISTLMPISGMQEILENLYNAKFTIGILTSNSIDNVNSWLDINQLRHFISFVHTESRFFTKRRLIKKTLKKYNIERSKAVYIGDETRDIEAAKKNRISSIGVTWGYNSEAAIAKYQPTFIAKNPADIIAWCESRSDE
jgi:phosphoglycolate phosphatase